MGRISFLIFHIQPLSFIKMMSIPVKLLCNHGVRVRRINRSSMILKNTNLISNSSPDVKSREADTNSDDSVGAGRRPWLTVQS